MEDQAPYHCLLQLSPLAVVEVDPKMPRAHREETVAVADILVFLEEQARLEDSLAELLTMKLVAEVQAQELLARQHQIPMAELAFQVQFLEAQRFMAAAAVVEVGKLELVLVKVVKEAVVPEEQPFLP